MYYDYFAPTLIHNIDYNNDPSPNMAFKHKSSAIMANPTYGHLKDGHLASQKHSHPLSSGYYQKVLMKSIIFLHLLVFNIIIYRCKRVMIYNLIIWIHPVEDGFTYESGSSQGVFLTDFSCQRICVNALSMQSTVSSISQCFLKHMCRLYRKDTVRL